MSMDPNNRFFNFMSKVGDFITLNLLFLFTSIPIFTIGASACALYSCIKLRIADEESTVFQDYKKAFKSNFIPATSISIVYILAFVCLYFFSSYIASHIQNFPLLILYLIYFMIVSFSILYVFPLQATFINEPLTIIKNAFFTSLKHLPMTLALFLCTYLPLVITWLFPQIFYFTFAYWIFIGCSICTCCSVLITKIVFQSYISSSSQ